MSVFITPLCSPAAILNPSSFGGTTSKAAERKRVRTRARGLVPQGPPAYMIHGEQLRRSSGPPVDRRLGAPGQLSHQLSAPGKQHSGRPISLMESHYRRHTVNFTADSEHMCTITARISLFKMLK